MLSGMNRDFLEIALVQVERHITRGEVILACQRARVAASERIGRNVALSKECLYLFEHCQRLHLADRDRLWIDLENANPGLKARNAPPTSSEDTTAAETS